MFTVGTPQFFIGCGLGFLVILSQTGIFTRNKKEEEEPEEEETETDETHCCKCGKKLRENEGVTCQECEREYFCDECTVRFRICEEDFCYDCLEKVHPSKGKTKIVEKIVEKPVYIDTRKESVKLKEVEDFEKVLDSY